MYEYDEECLQAFLEQQGKLFDEPVADTLEEAEAFLEEEGMDVDGMSMEEIEEAAEVFALPSGQYLIVEG